MWTPTKRKWFAARILFYSLFDIPSLIHIRNFAKKIKNLKNFSAALTEWEADRSTLVGRPTDRRPPSRTSRRGTPHLPASRSAIHTIHTSGSVFRIRNPVPFWPLDPGWVKSQDPNPGFRIRVEQPVSYYLELRNHFFGLKYLNSLMRIRDPGLKKSDPG
jgi:hypothetical protein